MKTILVGIFLLSQMMLHAEDVAPASACTIENVVDFHDGGSSLDEIRSRCDSHVANSDCSVAKIVNLAGSGKGVGEIQAACGDKPASTPKETQATALIYSDDPYPELPYCYTDPDNPAVTTCLRSCWACSPEYGFEPWYVGVRYSPDDWIFADYGFYGGWYYRRPFYHSHPFLYGHREYYPSSRGYYPEWRSGAYPRRDHDGDFHPPHGGHHRR